jgi:hypothetical protein
MISDMNLAVPSEVVEHDTAIAVEGLACSPGVIAVCVIGSAARGEDDDRSDIDLIALIADAAVTTGIRASLGRGRAGRRVQARLLTEDGLARLLQARSTFAVHVLRESIILHDPTDRLGYIFASHSREAPVKDDGSILRLRLEGYDELTWCQGLYLYCLSDLYSIGRAAAFTILGREAQFEFSGPRALDRLARERPELALYARRVRELRPFYVLVERNRSGELPFSYRDCHREARDARDASRALVAAIQ